MLMDECQACGDLIVPDDDRDDRDSRLCRRCSNTMMWDQHGELRRVRVTRPL